MLSVAIAKPPQFIEIVPGLFSTTVPASGRVAVDPHPSPPGPSRMLAMTLPWSV